MRYFLAAFVLCGVLLVGFLGFRGGISRKPPIEVFPDMDRQPKLRPEKPDPFFANDMGSRLPVPGTIARETPYQDNVVNTGKTASGAFVEANPLPITEAFMKRGQQRYTIFCAPCHSPVGDGKGIVTQYGLGPAANFHQDRLIQMPDGQIFDTITHGSKTGLMKSYASQVTITDRWAIIAYVRALQLSQLGRMADVPEQERSKLTSR